MIKDAEKSKPPKKLTLRELLYLVRSLEVESEYLYGLAN
jgi:hypothetical protein